ncbi:MAG: MBL fold metallo-hydrolase [Pseudomonadota bacterium]
MDVLIPRTPVWIKLVLNIVGVGLTAALLAAGAHAEVGAAKVDGLFVNDIGPHKMSFVKAASQVVFAQQRDKSPSNPIPMRQIETGSLIDAQGPVLYRLGHSSILLKLGGDFVLIDPVFSERASPLQWLGPRRFHPAPITIASLPKIDVVVISHNHYDHLDRGSVLQLADKVDHFLVPLGVGAHLKAWGVDESAITEMDWWEETAIGDLSFAATPAQHFSGRSLTDRNKTLWASWVIRGGGANLFFSGDSGYFDGFKQIGERYGPFDIAMVENGAYNVAWRKVHMMPEESVQAHLDLRGRAMLPIHNCTFDLSTHSWYEPLDRVSVLAADRGIHLLTPVIGAPVQILAPQPTYAWWRGAKEEMVAVANGSEGV